jgi:hypothetical protein
VEMPVSDSSLSSVSYAYPTQDYRQNCNFGGAYCAQDASLWGEDGFSFKDMLDVINPLQQLPVISTLYRDATGDTISAGARMLGGLLLGGPIGLAASAVNAGIEAATGEDIGAQILSLFEGGPPALQAASNAYAAAYRLE